MSTALVPGEVPEPKHTPDEYREEYEHHRYDRFTYRMYEVTRLDLSGGNNFEWSDGLGHLKIWAGYGEGNSDMHLCKEYGAPSAWSAWILRYHGLRPVEIGALPGREIPVVIKVNEHDYPVEDGNWRLDRATIAYGAAQNGAEEAKI